MRGSYSPGLLLCGQQSLVLTLAAAAGWAAVCYGTHMADAVGHKNMWFRSGKVKGLAPPKLWGTHGSGYACPRFSDTGDSLE